MKPFDFLTLAEWLFDNKKCPEGYRSSISRAYYGALHTAIVLFEEMGIFIPSGSNKHVYVPALLEHTNDSDLVIAGRSLEALKGNRHLADYKLKDASVEKESFAALRIKEASDIIATVSGMKIAPKVRFDNVKNSAKTYADSVFR